MLFLLLWWVNTSTTWCIYKRTLKYRFWCLRCLQNSFVVSLKSNELKLQLTFQRSSFLILLTPNGELSQYVFKLLDKVKIFSRINTTFSAELWSTTILSTKANFPSQPICKLRKSIPKIFNELMQLQTHVWELFQEVLKYLPRVLWNWLFPTENVE